MTVCLTNNINNVIILSIMRQETAETPQKKQQREDFKVFMTSLLILINVIIISIDRTRLGLKDQLKCAKTRPGRLSLVLHKNIM